MQLKRISIFNKNGIISIFFLLNYFFFSNISAQTTNNCKRPQTKELKYKCFIFLQNNRIQGAQENPYTPRRTTDFQLRIRAEQIEREKRLAEKQKRLQEQIEAARTRNVSNEGKKYRITYGKVLEPPL